MPTITATKAGNWSDTTVWDLSRVPEEDDDVALAGYTIVWDTAQTRIPATGTLTSITSVGTEGQITLDLSDAVFHSGVSLNVIKIQAGIKDGGIFSIDGTTTHELTINTGENAGEGIIGGSSSDASCVRNNGTGTINIVGNITGGDDYGNYTYGVINVSTGVINIYDSIISGRSVGHGLNSNYGIVNIDNSQIIGGTVANKYGIYNYNSVFNLTNTSIIGGSALGAFGFQNYESTAQVNLGVGCQLIQGSCAPAYNGKAPTWTSSLTNRAKFYIGASFGQAANTDFPQQLPAEDIKSGVTSGTVTGTLVPGGGGIFSF